MTVEESVLAAEDRYVAAEVDGDEHALRSIVHERFVMNRNDGTTADKDALIASVLAMGMTGQEVSERSVVVHEDAAVVCGTTELRFGGAGAEPSAQRLRYTATYVRDLERWQLFGLHMSPRREA